MDTLPRLKRGREAGYSCRRIAQGNRSPQVLKCVHAVEGDLGYGILLAKYAPDMNHVTPEQYRAAQRGAIPQRRRCSEFPYYGRLRFAAVECGDVDCVDTDAECVSTSIAGYCV